MEFVPQRLEPNTLYVSMEYATVVHSCLCGCGQRVVTPLTPTDWHLSYDGERVTLSRSIGNWSFPCRSHYWIEQGHVHWAGDWSKQQVEVNRAADLELKRRFYDGGRREAVHDELDGETPGRPCDASRGLWGRFRSWLSGRWP
ncbi:MAG: hypothetical protein JHC95_12205 [Solirubrobacteraceae bacterium]|nr:hypothetical protein [Solirubrobacteraceae bacterium]